MCAEAEGETETRVETGRGPRDVRLILYKYMLYLCAAAGAGGARRDICLYTAVLCTAVGVYPFYWYAFYGLKFTYIRGKCIYIDRSSHTRAHTHRILCLSLWLVSAFHAAFPSSVSLLGAASQLRGVGLSMGLSTVGIPNQALRSGQNGALSPSGRAVVGFRCHSHV